MRRKENRTIIKGAFVKKSIQLFKKKKKKSGHKRYVSIRVSINATHTVTVRHQAQLTAFMHQITGAKCMRIQHITIGPQ